ncbi:OmpA/MotB domain-containing protein [Arthrobacter crystallopoietes BAB-32]|uniref:OmpA/MotB domain-containing protein n=1 Tax=Arthrobacter crystallopoietes BAB-32 TaxID=1246476 RepID=N1V781_9MICC|nr:flagellar motor protein MotB [Arthrobacter crystallopoietes]EMY34108.1 OmpA/MotB domain-containing protein [Arthrobacter crystallopoietes BAB-32]
MSRSRRRKQPELEDFHPDERWAVSYLDMVTVLMCLFIVLFSMSSVDQQKFVQLKNSLATGFGVEEAGKVDTAEGVVVPAEMVDQKGEPTDLELALAEVDELEDLQKRITAALEEEGLAKTVRFGLDKQGLTMRMVSSETFFQPDKARLTPTATKVLKIAATELNVTDRFVTVEGHTARLPDDRYVLDWELSTERAVNVVRYMIEKGGVDSTRLKASGYGESRPLNKGRTEAELKLNRRVDIVVQSDESEAVRNLIPKVVEERSGH